MKSKGKEAAHLQAIYRILIPTGVLGGTCYVLQLQLKIMLFKDLMYCTVHTVQYVCNSSLDDAMLLWLISARKPLDTRVNGRTR